MPSSVLPKAGNAVAHRPPQPAGRAPWSTAPLGWGSGTGISPLHGPVPSAATTHHQWARSRGMWLLARPGSGSGSARAGEEEEDGQARGCSDTTAALAAPHQPKAGHFSHPHPRSCNVSAHQRWDAHTTDPLPGKPSEPTAAPAELAVPPEPTAFPFLLLSFFPLCSLPFVAPLII